jgi:hypothetical protein
MAHFVVEDRRYMLRQAYAANRCTIIVVLFLFLLLLSSLDGEMNRHNIGNAH